MQEPIPNYGPPSRLATLLELRAPLDWASLLYRAPQLAVAPKGDGRPVMLIPGYGTDERSMRPLGTPIIGGPKYTTVGRRFAEMANLDLDEFEKEVHARNSIGIKQPVTSIYSKSDGVVAWQASIDTYNKQARNIEVSSSHFGLGANGKVWTLIANLLANNSNNQNLNGAERL